MPFFALVYSSGEVNGGSDVGVEVGRMVMVGVVVANVDLVRLNRVRQ